MIIIPALEAVRGTTVDTTELKAYLFSTPQYLHKAYQIGVSDTTKEAMNRLDFVEFHFRRYLAGHPKTLHRVFHEIREFYAFSTVIAPPLIALSLNAVRYMLLTQEWYEIMPRYEAARSRIEKQFGPLP